MDTNTAQLPPPAAEAAAPLATVMMYSHHHPDFVRGKEWSTAAFDKFVSLPASRSMEGFDSDACLTLNAFCDGDLNLTGKHDIAEKSNGNNSKTTINVHQKFGGTTLPLPLFDEDGTLRSGLCKLNLHPNVMADGGISYQPKGGNGSENEIPIESFLEGGALLAFHPATAIIIAIMLNSNNNDSSTKRYYAAEYATTTNNSHEYKNKDENENGWNRGADAYLAKQLEFRGFIYNYQMWDYS
eukprot:CAMPEP_0172308992 /NCGR_PEP_ID=MMETSP1058-20130122/9422_1 /TAXON_ID=83371 /ORGANISM="Detonula confervacea, Strain CCMP 353" /LENGTH=240 /DNA_ID=CAMNT_0013021537 /DNA_START=322 /DNA_END=1045 /DNA_ORIENTATION=+